MIDLEELRSQPKLLRYLLMSIGVATLAVALLRAPLAYFTSIDLYDWLLLSKAGLMRGLIYLPLTSLFIVGVDHGITLSLCFSLFFTLYFLYLFAQEVYERLGGGRFFLTLYLFLGAGSLLAALFFVSSTTFVYGLTAPLFATFTLWSLIRTDATIYFLLLLQLPVRQIFPLVIAFSLLIDLSAWDFAHMVESLLGTFVGYLLGRFFLGLPNPYIQLESLDHFLTSIFGLFQKGERKRAEIISFPSPGDDLFIDAMLEKISKGEKLSPREQRKLDELAKKKKR